MDSFNNRFNQTEIDNGGAPIELHRLGSSVCTILFYISFVCCFFVLAGYAFIRYFDPKHDRLTLRLIVYSTLAHILLGISGIFRINSEKARNRDACNTIMFFYVFSNIFSTICITAIAVNLQIVFVHEKKSKHLEKWYLLASFIAAFIIAVIPLFPNVEAYNYNMNLHECWYWQPDSKTTTLWTIMGLYVWILVSTAYCLVALVLVLGKMWREEFIINEQLRLQMTSRHNNTYYRKNKWFYSFPWSLFFRPPQADPITDVLGQEEASVIDSNNNMNEQQQQQQPQQQQKRKRFRLPSIKYLRPQYILKLVSARVKHTLQTIKIIRKQQLQVSYVAKVASRVIWFPIILILSRIWSVIVYIMAYRDGKINPFMLFMTYLSIPMQGIFLLLIFVFDPSFHHAIRKAFSRNGEEQTQHKGINSIFGSTKLFNSSSLSAPSSPEPTMAIPEIITGFTSPPLSILKRPTLEPIQSQSIIYSPPLSIEEIERSPHGSIKSNATIPTIMSVPTSPTWQKYQQHNHNCNLYDHHHHPLYNKPIGSRSNNDLTTTTEGSSSTMMEDCNNNNNSTSRLLLPKKTAWFPNRRDSKNHYRLYPSDILKDEQQQSQQLNNNNSPDQQESHANKNDDDDDVEACDNNDTSSEENDVLRQL